MKRYIWKNKQWIEVNEYKRCMDICFSKKIIHENGKIIHLIYEADSGISNYHGYNKVVEYSDKVAFCWIDEELL